MINKKLFYSLQLIIILIVSNFILTYFSKKTLSLNELFLNTLNEQFSLDQVKKISSFKNKWEIFEYILPAFVLILKTALVTLILEVGCFFFEKKIKYKELFNIVVKAEFVFLLVIIFKTVWFYFLQPNYTLEDLKYFYPLSALNIIGYEGLQPWFIYPFQVLNLFELAYWIILAYLIGKEINSTKEKGLLIVASSYGVGLLIWVVGVMFLTLNIS